MWHHSLSIISLLVAALCLSSSTAIIFDPGNDIGTYLPCGEDNLACPRADGVMECFNGSMLCDGTPFCAGGSDEGYNLAALNCK